MIATKTYQNTLNNVVWLAFLNEGLHYTEDGQHCYREKPLDSTQTRTLYRWRNESAANFFAADRWLIRAGGHINEFMNYCYHLNVSPWGNEEPPKWYERNDWEEDLKSCDPKWRAEALAKKR